MKKEIIFSLPAEAVKDASKVCLMGDFNDWTSSKEFELKIRPDGSAGISILLEAGKSYRYRFLINDSVWVNDYHAERYEPVEGYGIDNCVITVPIEESVKATARAKSPAKTKSGKSVKKSGVKSVKTKSTTRTKTTRTGTGRKKTAPVEKEGDTKA